MSEKMDDPEKILISNTGDQLPMLSNEMHLRFYNMK